MITGRYNQELEKRIPWKKWTEYEHNPVVSPLFGIVVADPTVVVPADSPDGKWHMFICATWDTMVHLISVDGKKWGPVETYDWTGFSPFIFKDAGKFYLFYQRVERLTNRCYIACRCSEDLYRWGERHDIIFPELEWENMELRPTVRNACIAKVGGEFRLYYSGGVKILPDLKFEEPANIGVATATNILGPYTKKPLPILAPDENDPWRNIGCGGMKVYWLEKERIFLGFNNGIFRDAQGNSRSAIHMLVSADGYDWFDTTGNPILKPAPGWKESLVYQLCAVEFEGRLWVYFNCREGWEQGVERIGLAFGERN